MTDKADLDRVRAIHRFLDHCAATLRDPGIGYQSWVFREESGLNHSYTADEIRAWPEMKRRLADKLLENPAYCVAMLDGTTEPDAAFVPNFYGDRSYVNRGLCMYREMLEDEKPSIHAGPTAAQVREAYPSKQVDPYERHRLREESARASLSAWQADPENLAARARNIAALRVSLDRPISEQPHPREYFSAAVRRYR